MKTAVIYARYSSEKQTEQSIEGQLHICQEFARRNNILIVENYIDRALTGTNDNRASFQKMLKDSAKKSWDYVIVYKLDRFSRNKYEAVIHKKTLKDNGVKVLSAMENIPDTPEGTLMETLLEGFNQYFSEELAQKVRRGMTENRKKGLFTGGKTPYGYKVINKKVYVDEDQAKIVREIYDKYASGIYVKDIIQSLTDRGILNRGKKFVQNTIYKILKNEKYFGVVRVNGEVYTNIFPPIIPEHIYYVVRKRVDENHHGKQSSQVVYLLRNKVRCGYCNLPIQADCGTSKTGKVSRYYKCSGRKYKRAKCNKNIIRKDVLENLIVDTTFKIFDNSATISNIADKIMKIHEERISDNITLTILNNEKTETVNAINNLLACMEKGIFSNSTKNRLSELENKLNNIENKIAVEQSKEKAFIEKSDIIKFLRTSLKKEAAQMIRFLVKEIILYDDKVEIYYNYVDFRNSTEEEHTPIPIYNDTFETSIDEHKINGKPYTLNMKIDALI